MTEHPRIGIRPTIDGRRKGVRESLEEQTMNMAKSVADLFTSNLRYPDGVPVEVVIADTTIGRVHEAQACAAQVPRQQRGPDRDGDPVLVLRHRDHRHGPGDAARHLGLQRHRASRRRVPGRRPGRPRPDRHPLPSASTASTCRTPTTPRSPRTCVPASCDYATARPGRRSDEGRGLPVHGLGLHGYRRLRREPRRSSAPTWACATSTST